MDEKTEGWAIVAYRVGALETKLGEYQTAVMGKLDNISTAYGHLSVVQATQQSEMNSLGATVKTHSENIKEIEDKLVNVRISLAEKIVPGMLSGGALAGVVELIRLLMGAH